MKFGQFFGNIYKYWDYASKRGIGYSLLEVLIMTSVIQTHLKIEWDALGWDEAELKWICHALDNMYKILDPNNFIDCKHAYLNHLKICYYLDNNE